MHNFVSGYETVVRLSVFFFMFVTIASWELTMPRRELITPKWIRWRSNWSITVINTAVIQLLFPILGIGMAVIAAQNGWGVLNTLNVSEGFAIAIFILTFDLAIYWQHRIFHLIPVLWRLHRMHHIDPDFDVSTGIRFHPLSSLLSMLIKLSVIVLMGPPVVAVLISEVLLNATAMFNHGNIHISPKVDRVLRWFMVTPDMHRIHHSVVEDEHNRNFGFNFPWWDHLFGSYRDSPERSQESMTIGIEGFGQPQNINLGWLLINPFLKGPLRTAA